MSRGRDSTLRGDSVSRACLQLERDERRERIGVVDAVEVEAIVAIVEGVLTIYTSVLLNIQRDLSTYGGNNDSELTSDMLY